MSSLGMRVRWIAWTGEGVTLQDEGLAVSCAGDEMKLGTRRGFYGVGVASDDESDCGGDLGTKPPAYHARLAGRLFRGVEEEADVVSAAACECGCAGIGELSGGVSSRVRRGTDAVGGEEGVDGDKVGGMVEEGKGKGAYGEEGTDKGGEVAEAGAVCGVFGVEGACAVEKVGVGVARGGEARVDRAGAGQSTEAEHEVRRSCFTSDDGSHTGCRSSNIGSGNLSLASARLSL